MKHLISPILQLILAVVIALQLRCTFAQDCIPHKANCKLDGSLGWCCSDLCFITASQTIGFCTKAGDKNCIEDGESCHRSGSLGFCCSGVCNQNIGFPLGKCKISSSSSSAAGSGSSNSSESNNNSESGSDSHHSSTTTPQFRGDEVDNFFDNVLPKFKEIADNNNNGNNVNGSSSQILPAVLGTILVILLIGLTLIAVWYIRRRKRLSSKEVQEFMNGDPAKINAAGSAEEGAAAMTQEEFINYLPFNTAFDLPASKLDFTNSKVIGEGEFGFVTKAAMNGLPVAVKAVKPNTDKLYIKTLLSELKIMIKLGKHPHVISLVGAVTEGLSKGMLLIVVDYCELGDLKTYLRAHADNFAPRAYENYMKNSITTERLISWCEQIAKGMEYLESQTVVHADLAARNVLLTSEFQVKITDFGLSRQLYTYTTYVKKTKKVPLPWHHLAIESLKYKSFSTESDVWAHGVTMWEIFSLGEEPYPGKGWTLEFVHELENGLKLLQPKHAPDFIYEIMIACWNLNKFERPFFSSLTRLKDAYEQLIQEKKTKVIAQKDSKKIEYTELPGNNIANLVSEV